MNENKEKELLKQDLDKLEGKEEIEKFVEDAGLLGYEDIAKLGREKINAISEKAGAVEKTSDSQISQVESMGGSKDVITEKTAEVDKEIDQVKTEATEQIKEIQNENIKNPEDPTTVYENKAKKEISELETEIKENFKRRDEIYKNVCALTGINLDQLKDRIFPAVISRKRNENDEGDLWLDPGKSPEYYGIKGLKDEDKEKYQELNGQALELYYKNRKMNGNIRSLKSRMESVHEGKTEQGKKELILKLENAEDYRIGSVFLLDALEESGVLSESEIVQSLNKRLSNLSEDWYKNINKDDYNNKSAKAIKSYISIGGSLKMSAQEHLRDLPKEMRERIKNSPEASEQLKEALEFDLISSK